MSFGAVVAALIILFGVVSFALTFDSVIRGLVLMSQIALPVALLVTLVAVRRRNRRRMDELDDL